jgi:hypothetical protein
MGRVVLLTIHSAERGRPLFSSGGRFKVWRYGVGHSQLLLRSAPTGERPDSLDVHFEYVTFMKLAATFDSLAIYRAEEIEVAELPDEMMLLSGGGELLPLALVSPNTTGIVVCSSASVRKFPWEPGQPEADLDNGETLWVMKS